MHTIIHPSQWRAAFQRLNLTMYEVSKRAKIQHSTLSRGLRQEKLNFEQATIEAVSRVLVEAEKQAGQERVA